MHKLGFPVAPLVLASVLAQMLETSLQQSLLISQGSPAIFFTRPIALFFMVLGFLSVARGVWKQMKSGRRKSPKKMRRKRATFS